MSADRIFSVNEEGKLTNVGRNFKSYETSIVMQCARIFLGEDAREYKIKAPQMGKQDSNWDFDCNDIIVYAVPTPAAHESVLRLMRIAGCDSLDGYCFVVTECGKTHRGLHGVFTDRTDLEKYVAKVPAEVAEELFIRIVPFNTELI